MISKYAINQFNQLNNCGYFKLNLIMSEHLEKNSRDNRDF